MADSIPLEVGLPPSFFLEQEGAIDLLLTFSDWDCPSHEEDIRAAVSLMVPAGCSAELIRLGGWGWSLSPARSAGRGRSLLLSRCFHPDVF